MVMESKPTITEEPDKKENLNWTQNPTENDEILLAYIEEVQKPNEIWINAKTSNDIKFHFKHDEKKENAPLDQLVPEGGLYTPPHVLPDSNRLKSWNVLVWHGPNWHV